MAERAERLGDGARWYDGLIEPVDRAVGRVDGLAHRLWRQLRVNPMAAVAWLSPVIVYVYLRAREREPGLPDLALVASVIAATLFVLYVSRHPTGGLTCVVVLLPFQASAFALMYRFGFPEQLLRPMASWKEGVVLGLGLSAMRARRDPNTQPLDRIDALGMAFVGLVGLYALFPRLFFFAAPIDTQVRLNAFRISAGFVILFLVARHAPIAVAAIPRLLRWAFAIVVFVAAVGIVEFLFEGWWNDFAINTLQVQTYFREVLDTRLGTKGEIRTYTTVAGREVLRIGSILFSPIAVCFAFVTGLAIGCERILIGKARQSTVIGTAAIALAILLTQTRSALIAAALVALLATRARPHRLAAARARFGLILVGAAILAMPVVASSGLGDRISTGISGEDKSSQDHRNSFDVSYSRLAEHPLGEGLGISAGTAARYGVADAAIGENYYLQVGNETGVASLALFVALTVTVVATLKRRSLESGVPGIPALHGALFGLAVASFFLHVWIDLAVAWPIWGLAGAAIGALDRERAAAVSPELALAR